MDELDYSNHYAFYAQLIGTLNAESKRYVQKKAQEVHLLHVHDALRDEQLHALELSRTLKDEQAQYFVRFGIGRRVGLLWSAFRSILELVPVGRDVPLRSDDVKEISRDLNTIYINIVGTIDNYAWCLRHERGSKAIRALPANKVGLFVPKFCGDECFSALGSVIESYRPWFNELRARRDPAAHRIPLSVPPSVLRAEEAARHRDIGIAVGEAFRVKDYERVDELWAEQERLGTFLPLFLHHPQEDLVPFYPTIPQDLANLVRVSRAVRDFLKQAG